jgi:hypothetical protein
MLRVDDGVDEQPTRHLGTSSQFLITEHVLDEIERIQGSVVFFFFTNG